MRVVAGAVGDLPPGARRSVPAGDREVLVLNIDGRIVAIDGRCPHKGNSLVGGMVRDGVITCPSHLWRFEVESGRRRDAPGPDAICYPVEVERGLVVVTTPEPEPQRSVRDMLLDHAKNWSRGG